MGKLVVAFIGLIASLGGVLYLLGGDEPEIHVEIPEQEQAPSAKVSPSPKATPKKLISEVGKAVVSTKTTTTTKLETTSDEFSDRIDVGIPDHFRAQMAACERDGIDPNAKITIRFMLHIEDDVISASTVTIENSTLGNSELEQCMLIAVQDTRWIAEDMPNFNEEQDIFVRMRSLDKYLSAEEQKDAKERKNLEE